MRLLLAEDEKELSDALVAILKHNNYSVDAVYDGEEAWDYLQGQEYDGVILDIMMPKMDGITVLKKVREQGNNVPILMLTAKSGIDDKVLGLDSGADDYLGKPFAMKELLARIRAMTRRKTEVAHTVLKMGNLTLDRNTYELQAETKLLIENGDINITECYEGLEAIAIDVIGGNINIVASDDGLNAAGGNDQSGNESGWMMMDTNADAYINIAGGVLYVDAGGDGVDSNGSLYVSGGETYVAGPRNSGNGALDYAIDAQVSGGTFVATGMSGMAMNFGSNSTQGAIMNNIANTIAEGTVIELTDASGNVILSYTTTKECNSIVISCAGIEKDQTYTLKMGEETTEIQMTDIIYGASNGMGGGFGGQGDFGGGKGGFGGGRGQDGQNGERPDKGEMPEGMQNGEMPEGGMPQMSQRPEQQTTTEQNTNA